MQIVMSQNETTPEPDRKDGLHCVYDRCKGPPLGPYPSCNAGCYFQGRVLTDLELLRRMIGDQHGTR